MKNKFNCHIPSNFIDKSLRNFFEYFHVSKAKIYKLFLEKRVLVNDEIKNERYILKSKDLLTLNLENFEIKNFEPTRHSINIIYEDDFMLVIDKPEKTLVHPDSEKNNHTLVNYVSAYLNDKNQYSQLRYPHRLDFDTTGLIIFSKIFFFQSYLDYLIAENRLERYYNFLICGNLENKSGTINYRIIKDKKKNKMIYDKTGQAAITKYKLLKNYDEYALVEAKLDTGRMHQIRIHFSLLGYPLIGDVLYNTKINASRVLLHSKRIQFYHPFLEKNLTIEIDNSEDIKRYL